MDAERLPEQRVACQEGAQVVPPRPNSGESTLGAARTVAGLTLASRLLGLLRELALANFFGTNTIVSAFRLAFMVPNLARRLFGEGALSAALIPVLTETLEEQGRKSSRRLVGALTIRVAAILIGIVVLAEIILGVVRLFASDPVLDLSAVLLPYMPLICLVALNCGVLHVRRRFALPAALPILLNVCIVTALYAGHLVWRPGQNYLIYFACGGVIVSVILQWLISIVALQREDFVPLLRGPVPREPLRRVSRMMGGAAIGLSAVQLNSLFDYLIAYGFVVVDGERVGPAVLGAAHFLYQLPLGVFGIAIATAIFPSLSLRATQQDRQGFLAELGLGLRMSMLIAFPSLVGLLFIAYPLVEALFEHGEFTSESTVRVAGTLQFYALGMAAYFANHVLIRAYYAHQDSRTPARITVVVAVINLVLNLILVQFMEERGLALATAVCANIQSFLLWKSLPVPGAGGSVVRPLLGLIRPALATGVMALALTALSLIPFLRNILLSAGWMATVLKLGTGVISFWVAARVFCPAELRMFLGRGSR